ncbi:MAG: response regulator [Thermacetogeniaceae bacterium]
MLAVDDSHTIRTAIKIALEPAGFSITLAADGEEALGALSAERRFDLIITDLHMPKLDGIALIKAVRSNPFYRFTPILMLTTESQAEKKDEGRKAGATGWIVKPFQPEQLMAVVRKLIRV